jgi:hypothetical protein
MCTWHWYKINETFMNLQPLARNRNTKDNYSFLLGLDAAAHSVTVPATIHLF